MSVRKQLRLLRSLLQRQPRRRRRRRSRPALCVQQRKWGRIPRQETRETTRLLELQRAVNTEMDSCLLQAQLPREQRVALRSRSRSSRQWVHQIIPVRGWTGWTLTRERGRIKAVAVLREAGVGMMK